MLLKIKRKKNYYCTHNLKYVHNPELQKIPIFNFKVISKQIKKGNILINELLERKMRNLF